MEKGEEANWSEAVEDLVTAGDTEAAISLLQDLVSKLETSGTLSKTTSSDLQLASALSDLANLYSSTGFSLKADDLRARASLIKHRALSPSDVVSARENLTEECVSLPPSTCVEHESSSERIPEKSTTFGGDDSPCKSSSDDDWEAIADRDPNELLSSEGLPRVSNLSVEYEKDQASRRRGRGTFSYEKNELYSDKLSDRSIAQNVEDEDINFDSERKMETIKAKYGTRHVLVLADFSPSTTTTDLEKLFQDYRDRGVVIRWVNDTTALAVFRTPTIAIEARNHVRCPFNVRILDEDDVLLGSIAMKELEPPRQRPKTSAITAQRLIAQSVGLKLPSSSSGSKEFKDQEEARRNRIVTRQRLRDDAWGAD